VRHPIPTDTKVGVVSSTRAPHGSGDYGESPISINGVVSVVDDDESVRESVPHLLRSFGYEACAFDSAEAFLASGLVDATKCLVLDIAMPGMSGPELHAELVRQGRDTPVIFITGNRNSDVCDELRRHGAVACLSKPFDPNVLLEAVRRAL
jgi:FixJ family two-component response regulator